MSGFKAPGSLCFSGERGQEEEKETEAFVQHLHGSYKVDNTEVQNTTTPPF